MLVTKKIEFDMGHRVPNHKSKCRNLHGHRYVVEVGVEDSIINEPGSSSEGMVIDFGDLKQLLMEKIHDQYDHGFMIFAGDEFVEQFLDWKRSKGQNIHIVEFVPTAENLAKHFYAILETELLKKGIKLNHITVWETPTSTAHINSGHVRNGELV